MPSAISAHTAASVSARASPSPASHARSVNACTVRSTVVQTLNVRHEQSSHHAGCTQHASRMTLINMTHLYARQYACQRGPGKAVHCCGSMSQRQTELPI